VLFQTQNYWDMLQLLRPTDGVRMLWVDAVCINQRDLAERQDQVAKMGSIYADAARVVVYLGKDIVTPRASGQYCKRRRLHTLLEAKSLTLADILKRKYFTRVWVIQELVLSRQALIRIGDTEYWTDQIALQSLQASKPKWDRERTPAPWFRHAATNATNILPEIDQGGLYDLLRMTWGSRATDSRDRVYGTLGLTRNGRWQSRLRPDYSISSLHDFVGIFAHCLLNLKDTRILAHAAGIQAWRSHPSWVPIGELQCRSPSWRPSSILTPNLLKYHGNLLGCRILFSSLEREKMMTTTTSSQLISDRTKRALFMCSSCH